MADLLTHWGQDKIDAILQTTFSNAISWMKMFEFRLKFHWSLFLKVQLTIFQQWFRYWLGAVQATSHYVNQWWLVYRRIYPSRGLNDLNSWLYACKVGTRPEVNWWAGISVNTFSSLSCITVYPVLCACKQHKVVNFDITTMLYFWMKGNSLRLDDTNGCLWIET